MPIDTDLTVPNAGQSSGNFMSNPLGVVNDIVGLRGQLLQQQGAQQGIQLNQSILNGYSRAGQIISSAPPGTDMDGIVKMLQADPTVAQSPKFSDILTGLRTAQSTNITMRGARIDQDTKAMDFATRSLARVDKPSDLDSTLTQSLALLPKDVQAEILPSVKLLRQSLMHGVQGDDADSTEQLHKNITGALLSAGVPGEIAFGSGNVGAPRGEMANTGPGGAPQSTTVGGYQPRGGPPTGITPGEEEFQKTSAQKGGEIVEEINANASGLPTALKRVDLMAQALGQFQAGGGADIRAELGKVAQGLKNAGIDISDDTIKGIANGSLPAGQVFDSLISRAGVQALKADAQGTGKVMRSEVDRYLEMMSKTNDPNALVPLLNNLKYTMAVGYDQSQKWLQFKKLLASKDPSVQGLDSSDFHAWYNHNFDPDQMELPKGMNLGPINPSQIQGTSNGLEIGESRKSAPGVTIRRTK